MEEKIYLSSPHLGGEEMKYVEEAFNSNWVAPLGPNVDFFEKELVEVVHGAYAVALSSGTAALHLALKALGIQRGDKVFCSSLTFSASCNPIIYEGAIPVFIDCEPESWNMSPLALEKAFEACDVSSLPKAVIVVNLYGQSADFDALKKICDKYQVPIVEDAAESLGATYGDRYTGTIGSLGVFSFNGNKIITTSGGGMLISANEEYIDKAKFWATQARENERHYEHRDIGYNYRLSNISAGIGRGQLRILDKRIEKKKEIYDAYKEAFKHIEDIEMMPIKDYGKPNYWLSAMLLKENSPIKPIDIILALEKENIESRPIWKPMHRQPVFCEYPFYSHNDGGISVSEDIYNRGICLPSDTKMTDRDISRVINIVKELWENYGDTGVK